MDIVRTLLEVTCAYVTKVFGWILQVLHVSILTNALIIQISVMLANVSMNKAHITVNARLDICQCQEEVSYALIRIICISTKVVFSFLEECVDMRKETCYLKYSQGECTAPMSQDQTRLLCCCSMGEAWGRPCEPCPAQGTSMYNLI